MEKERNTSKSKSAETAEIQQQKYLAYIKKTAKDYLEFIQADQKLPIEVQERIKSDFISGFIAGARFSVFGEEDYPFDIVDVYNIKKS